MEKFKQDSVVGLDLSSALKQFPGKTRSAPFNF
jgi:hypothetical protein